VRWIVLASISAAGCQQILGFEDGIVATVGHDEDLDGIDDGIDNCPADENQTQSNTEPRIGRVCDPRPEQEGDRIAAFFSFFPAGPPAELDSDLGVRYDPDKAWIEDATLRTHEPFAPTVVAAELTFGTFVGVDAFAELSVGNRSCRIASCNSRICIVVADDAETSSKEFTPTALGVTFALVQSDTLFACVLTLQGVAVSLARTERVRETVGVRVEEASMYLENLTIYDLR
jgi:hypothetical protein